MHFIFNNLGWQLIANNNTLIKSTCPTTTIKKRKSCCLTRSHRF